MVMKTSLRYSVLSNEIAFTRAVNPWEIKLRNPGQASMPSHRTGLSPDFAIQQHPFQGFDTKTGFDAMLEES
jgi:hypothetical protein